MPMLLRDITSDGYKSVVTTKSMMPPGGILSEFNATRHEATKYGRDDDDLLENSQVQIHSATNSVMQQ